MVLAFTVAPAEDMFMGNQRQLHAAAQTCDGNGCTWADNALVDGNGRLVHAESPVATLNKNGQAQITYRALGFGASIPGGPTILPGDPLGTITGAIGQAFVTISGAAEAVISPTYQTSGGNTVWQPAAVYDPALQQVYAAASQSAGPTLPQQMVNALEAAGIAVDGLTDVVEPLALEIAGSQPDFAIQAVTASSPYLQPGGDPLSVVVSLVNNGPGFTSGRETGDLVVRLAWDGPVGLGLPAGEGMIPAIDAGSMLAIEFSSDPAAGTLTLPEAPHLPHKLYVQVNPAQTLPESGFTNNQFVLEMGGLPAPEGLFGTARPGDSSVFLEWLPVEHEAVAGYRVYRSSDGRVFEPVGSSFIPGFVDLTGVLGESYLYAVAAYAEDGFESGLGETIQAVVGVELAVYLPVVMR